MKTKLILITNPGSASRKYALYNNQKPLCAIHFEYEKSKVICTVKDIATDTSKKIDPKISDLGDTVSKLREILEDGGYVTPENPISAILARVVASGEYFTSDHIVDDECLRQFEIAKTKSPLHVPVVAAEINHFRHSFSKTPIIAISDSSFHTSRPDLTKYYCIDTELADKAEIKRFGFHGLSVGYVTEFMKSKEILPEKLVVCHIGSGSSITAVFNGASMDTSMGYSPLEGLMMSTRSGSLDLAAAVAIKKALNITDDEELEKYLNKKSGLLGVSGSTDDMRDIIQKRDEGDPRATFAHALYVYRIQSVIGHMVATLGGIDALVFTATIGERSAEIRRSVMQKLAYLGFKLDASKNDVDSLPALANIAKTDSKPIYVIRTDETAEMIRRALPLIP